MTYIFCLFVAIGLGLSVGIFATAPAVVAVVGCSLGLIYAWIFVQSPRQVLLLFLVFVLLQWLVVENLGGKFTPLGRAVTYADEAIILISFTLVLFGLFLKGDFTPRTGLGLPLLGIGAVGIVSSIRSHVPLVIAGSGLLLLLKGFLVLFIFAHVPFEEGNLRRYVVVFAIVCCAILFLGFLDFVNPEAFRAAIGNVADVEWRFGIASVQSLFIHPGIFGWFCALAALFSLAFYFVTGRRICLVLFILFTLGLLLSMRRKPVAGVVVGAGVGILSLPLRRRVRVGLVLGVLVIFLGVLFAPQITGIVHEGLEIYLFHPDPMSVARSALYMTGVRVARDHFPLGAGLGRYGGYIAASHYSPMYEKYDLDLVSGLEPGGHFLDDTFWPLIVGELGVLGLILYLWVCWRLFLFSWRAYRELGSPLIRGFALGTCMVFVEGLVESLADPVFVKPPQAYFLFGSMGIVYSLIDTQRRKKAIDESLTRE